jgi:hypothetical protein
LYDSAALKCPDTQICAKSVEPAGDEYAEISSKFMEKVKVYAAFLDALLNCPLEYEASVVLICPTVGMLSIDGTVTT